MTLDMNFVRIAVTVVSFAVFVGIVLYAAHPKNRKRFEEAGKVPFDGEEGR
jgi:cytochrome c oxidase cbb3-type subunit 4